jgi:hypothetical protein
MATDEPLSDEQKEFIDFLIDKAIDAWKREHPPGAPAAPSPPLAAPAVSGSARKRRSRSRPGQDRG